MDNNELLKYKSPITIVAAQLRMQTENNVWKCIQDMGIDINKEELLKALEYDREQYTKGYEDAKVEFGKYANWRSCEEALPSIGEHVLVQTICDTIHAVFFRGTSKCWGENIDTYIRPSMVKYWAPLLPIKED